MSFFIKPLVTALAIMPLLLTGTLAHADDDDRRPKKTVIKKTKAKKSVKKHTPKYVKAKTTKAKQKGCYEYDDGRYQRDDDCDDHHDRDDD